MPSKGKHKFHGVELLDAEVPMSIPLLQVDIDNAETYKRIGINDPRRFKTCVVAQACGRAFGRGGEVRINRTTAYVLWEGANNALRYELSDETRQVVEHFDNGHKVTPGMALTFNPPTPQRQLETMRKHYHKTKKTFQKGTPRKQRRRDSIDLTLRHGAFAK